MKQIKGEKSFQSSQIDAEKPFDKIQWPINYTQISIS